MTQEWMTVEAYFAQPGSERSLAEAGLRRPAIIDAASEISVVTQELVNEVYGGSSHPYSIVTVEDFNGEMSKARTVPLLVGIDVESASTAHAQVNCVLGKDILIGGDVLSLLGLELSIDYQEKRVRFDRYTWDRFEDEVASLYRALGASVKQNVNLAGFQVDMLIEESTPSGRQLRLAVECKFYKERIGNRVVNDFGRVVATLKGSNLVDRGVIVAHRGFTQDATLVGQNLAIDLLTLDDLKQQVPGKTPMPPPREKQPPESKSRDTRPARRFFVVMPFAPELEDVYHLGIRETVKTIGGACERADEIHYTGGILQKIYDSIRNADAILAEVSTPNPNVYYEVGFAHALEKPVVLLTRDIASSPFDLRGYDHLVYSSIVELRGKIEPLLRHLIS